MHSANQLYRDNNYHGQNAIQDSSDQLHRARLLDIFETIGYPTEQIVG